MPTEGHARPGGQGMTDLRTEQTTRGATVRQQLVLQPRGSKRVGGPRNYQHSIRQGRRDCRSGNRTWRDAAVLAALYPSGVARLWGSAPTNQPNNAKVTAPRDRRVGDHVLFYADAGFFVRARIVHLLPGWAQGYQQRPGCPPARQRSSAVTSYWLGRWVGRRRTAQRR